MPTLVLDLERSSMCCYLLLVESLLGQCNGTQHSAMRNIEKFPAKQMYLYLSLVERKVAKKTPRTPSIVQIQIVMKNIAKGTTDPRVEFIFPK